MCGKMAIYAGIWAAVMATGPLRARDISFTGGTDGTGVDLAAAANWDGGALPTADDTGVVTVREHGGGYVLSGNLALGGIRFENKTAPVSLVSEHTLTLGAAGLTLTGAGGVELRVPLATAADQTWNFGMGAAHLHATVSGTATLTIAKADGSSTVVYYHKAPNYGGKIIGKTEVRYFDRGRWADSYEGSAVVYFMMTGNVEITASELLPGGYSNTAWDPNTVWCRQDGLDLQNNPTYGYLLYDTDNWTCGGVGPMLSAGRIRQTGGVLKGLGHGPQFGSSHPQKTQPGYGNSYPVSYLLEGGVLEARNVTLGDYQKNTRQPYAFKQTGGRLSASVVSIGGGRQSNAGTWAEYVLGGGTLNVGVAQTERMRAIQLFAAGDDAGEGAGFFLQTGGVAQVHAVRWGAGDVDHIGSPLQNCAERTRARNSRGFGLFELRDGAFNLGAGGFGVSKWWNTVATNAGYAVNLWGGTLVSTVDQTCKLALNLPPSETPFTLRTDGTFRHLAPLAGEGTLVKTGGQALYLTDATRFRGSLRVEAGEVSLVGNGSFEDLTEGAFVWTGDDVQAKQALEDGNALNGWTATDGQTTFTQLPTPAESTVAVTAPTLKADDAAFAGHASVSFNKSVLKLAAEQNPLSGVPDFTVALVFRIKQGDLTCTEKTDYAWFFASSLLGSSEASITLSHTREGNLSSTPRVVFGCTRDRTNGQYFSEPDYDMNDGRAHVVVISCTTNGVAITGDGFDGVNDLPASATAWFRNCALYLGGKCNEDKFTHVNQFTYAHLAELRLYPNRALSEVERFRVGTALARTYGLNEPGTIRSQARVAGFPEASAEPEVPATDYVWDADDLATLKDGGDRADGAEVTAWPVSGTAEDRLAATKAKCSGQTLNAPTFVKGAANGHAAVRFDRARKTGLATAKNENPLSGATSWSAVVVFRTTVDSATGTGGASAAEVSGGEGIFGARNNSWACSDWGFSWHREGTILAAWGFGPESGYSTKRCFFSRNPFRLNDGLPHVAVLTCDGAAPMTRYFVDGREIATSTSKVDSQTTENGGTPLMFGLLNYGAAFGYFSGDIFAARLYTQALTPEECRQVCNHYATRLGFARSGMMPVGLENLEATGLAATNVTVADGATLRLPRTDAAPYLVRPGVSLNGAGTVKGTVRFASGAVQAAEGPSIEEARLAPGAVLAVAYGTVASLGATVVEGPLSVRIEALPANGPVRAKTKLCTFASLDVAEGATLTPVGAHVNGSMSLCVVDNDLYLVAQRGLTLIIR